MSEKESIPSQPISSQELVDIFSSFERGRLDAAEESTLIGRLKDNSQLVMPFLIEQLIKGTTADKYVASHLLSIVVDNETAKEALWKIVCDASIADWTRAIAMSTLEHMGEKVDYEYLFAHLKEPETFFKNLISELLRARISVNEIVHEDSVQNVGETHIAKKEEMIRRIFKSYNTMTTDPSHKYETYNNQS